MEAKIVKYNELGDLFKKEILREYYEYRRSFFNLEYCQSVQSFRTKLERINFNNVRFYFVNHCGSGCGFNFVFNFNSLNDDYDNFFNLIGFEENELEKYTGSMYWALQFNFEVKTERNQFTFVTCDPSSYDIKVSIIEESDCYEGADKSEFCRELEEKVRDWYILTCEEMFNQIEKEWLKVMSNEALENELQNNCLFTEYGTFYKG